jgi:hypothetical protein
MEKDKVIDKIKKLLELAASPVEAEAKLAYQKAQALMAQYSVSINNEEAKPEDIVTQEYVLKVPKSSGLLDNLVFIAQAVGKPFGVYVVIHSTMGVVTKVKLVGFKTNVILVDYALDCILTQCVIDFRAAYAQERSISFAPNFWRGVVEALTARFAQSESSEAGLVVYDPVKEFMKKFQSTSLSGTFANSNSGKVAGFEAGSKATIRPAVGGQNTGKLLQ